jgi:hypothetical protein
MKTYTRTTDAKSRLTLPKSFANSTIIIEQVSENEILIRRAPVLLADEIPFREETTLVLTNRDRDRFLADLESPPKPNSALRKAATRLAKNHG